MTYVAFLRAINAGVNVQKMQDLRNVFEGLGFQNVRTVLATGNVLFETQSADKLGLEKQIEQALSDTFGSNIVTIVRTQSELQKLINDNPFKHVLVTPQTKPHVTFLKHKSVKTDLHFPHHVPAKGYTILGIIDGAVCSVVDLSGGTTPDLMAVLDKTFGKTITTRSWNTVLKVASK